MNQLDVTEVGEVAQAIVAWGEAIVASLDPVDAVFARLGLSTDGHSEAARRTYRRAIELGATDEVMRVLIDCRRIERRDTIVLPPGRYEHLSRGRGWARQGKGSGAAWGEREDGGYRVGPGRWTVGSTDGFARKDNTEWVVTHVAVGDETWTVAS